MSLTVGTTLPSATLRTLTAHGPREIATDDFFKGRKVVVFSVVGAFTGTCNDQLPTFLEHYDAIRERGVDEIACLSLNDMFVLDAWSKANGAEGKITMLSDGNGEFSTALGTAIDASAFGLGTRTQRYAMVVDDGTVTAVEIEENPGVCSITNGARILQLLS
ncbi:MAG: redoxin family protein [Planctomycetota bacterium]|jgi:peroxiredoxin